MTGVVKVVARTHTQAMEQLQEGYVQAVAATAGVIAEFRRRDLHKYDVELTRQPDVSNEEAAVRLQLKATTTSRPRVGATHLSFTLKSTKDLESLAMERTTIKHILVVMVVGADQHDWTEATHEGLTTRHCCYWVNLEGASVPQGVASPTVHVPLSQVFDAEALNAILDRVEKGEPI